MSFIKQGEDIKINGIESTESCIPAVNAEILENFKKTAINLKKIAPRAEDFLYFSAVMMHAAEAAALNEDGTPKLNKNGDIVAVGWDKSDNTWRWTTNDPNIRPYKNSNGDIFPEEELVKAYKKWVHKPLCIDHKSSSVDHVRGFIVDTYYDRNLKRVVALCALDKHNYPELARKVATGYSSSVSMGTAVGRAICSDCARVARAESDFCDHMKRKSGYGEINVDLNPIELSIVVNGADPKAHIKHIIAAANTLNSYIESKSKEFNKFADVFRANISFTNGDTNQFSDNAQGRVTNVEVVSKDLETFRKDVDKAIADFDNLKNSLNEENNIEESGNDSASNQSSSSITMDEGATAATDSGLAPPTERYASAKEEIGEDSINNLRKVMAAMEDKLHSLTSDLEKLANTYTNKQEENMSGSKEINKKGYYQGGGGVNEPTPGSAKYPSDPTNVKLRTDGDKHMEGQMDTGPVEGMHPGPDSVGMNELERKKMLARAQAEENTMRRTAIVNLAKQAIENKKAALENKTGYHQGGGGVNEPTPGKPKYPVDKLNEQLREEDKHMVGQKPFSNVGPVDGLHPSPNSAETSDELKRKELLRRANTLRARFMKASNNDGSQNLGKSAWEVYLGDKLLLTASVDNLSGGNPDILYDKIATTEFGTKLIEKIKVQGADSIINSFVKKAQDPGAPTPAPTAGGASLAPAGDAPPADMGSDPSAEPNEDSGNSGDPKQTAIELAEKVRDLGSDLVEAVRALAGEKSEMGSMEGAPEAVPEMSTAGSFSTETLNILRKNLNGALSQAMKSSIAELNEHKQELDMISSMYDNGAVNSANAEFVGSLVEDAFNEAKSAIADGLKLTTAFVKYARGTEAIVKRAQIEAELEALADGEHMGHEHEHEMGDHSDSELMSLIEETNADLAADDNDVVMTHTPEEAAQVAKENPNVAIEVKKAFESKAGRAQLRAKLAADALGKEEDGEIQDMSKAKFSDMLDQADRLADGRVDFDVKPTGDLGTFKTLEEKNKAMMDLAKAPPKVRKDAAEIQRFITEGSISVSEIDSLVANGVDKDAVAYWKKFYGQTDGGSEFASELVKEHVKADMEEQLNTFKVKMARAYELAYEMVETGLCLNDRHAISDQVDQIMKFDNNNFETLKRVVAKNRAAFHKEAGRVPQVGMIGSGEVNTSNTAEDDWSQLSAALAKPSKRMF